MRTASPPVVSRRARRGLHQPRRARRRRRAGAIAGGLLVTTLLVAAGGTAATSDLGTGGHEATASPAFDTAGAPHIELVSELPTLEPPPPPPPPPPPVYRTGDSGPEVRIIQQRLADLRYDIQNVDGVYDTSTWHAVMAFQKVNGLSRDGNAGPETNDAIRAASGLPEPMVPFGAPDRIEVDLARQVVFLYQGGELAKIISASSGSGEIFCDNGSCRRAVTPGGDYTVGRRYTGWEEADLGRLYNPLYFNLGIAIHGAESVPGYPASHGCVRVPIATAEWLPSVVSPGMPVHVLNA